MEDTRLDGTNGKWLKFDVMLKFQKRRLVIMLSSSVVHGIRTKISQGGIQEGASNGFMPFCVRDSITSF